MKIFIGPVEVAGYYIRLHLGFSELKIKSDYFCQYHPLEYSSLKDYKTFLGKLLYLLTKYKYNLTKPKKRIISAKRFFNNFFNILILITNFLILIYSLFKYDIFIFSFGESILPNNLDLPILKLLKKKLFSMYSMEAKLDQDT